ncbi:UNVERIFIED_CONTAM: hypothetical protein NCL1_24243 [Trichonephila clavipes]
MRLVHAVASHYKPDTVLNPPRPMQRIVFCRPSGIVVSEADCGALGPGFDSRGRHGCL